MSEYSIPIHNIYYMLCYAWGYITQAEKIDLDRLEGDNVFDLLGTVLVQGAQHLYRRGLELGYQNYTEVLTGIKGRIDITRTAKHLLAQKGKVFCSFDELTANSLANQIIKSTLTLLLKQESLNEKIKNNIRATRNKFSFIQDINITTGIFRTIQLHSNNQYYKFILNICELIHESSFVSQEHGKFKFYDFTRDEKKMSHVFQCFLYHFIKKECIHWNVKRPHIKWDAESATDPDLLFLPRMETDITLSQKDKTVIVDAKYYQSIVSKRYGVDKFYSSNLYQLMCYLHNFGAGKSINISGMLIYPMTDRNVHEVYTINNYDITICTIDLNQPWKGIRSDLLALFS